MPKWKPLLSLESGVRVECCWVRLLCPALHPALDGGVHGFAAQPGDAGPSESMKHGQMIEWMIKWMAVGPLHHVSIILLLITVIWIVKLCLYLVGRLWTATIAHIYLGERSDLCTRMMIKTKFIKKKRFLIQLFNRRGQDFSVLSEEILCPDADMLASRRLSGRTHDDCMTSEGGTASNDAIIIAPSANGLNLSFMVDTHGPKKLRFYNWIRRNK